MKNLNELNPEVKGDFKNMPVEEAINNQEFIKGFNLIVICNPNDVSCPKLLSLRKPCVG